MPTRSTNNQTLLGRKLIPGHLQIQRRRPLPDPATDIVVAAVAGTEPAAEIARLADGDAAQMRADAQHDQPLGPLDAVLVGLGVAQAGGVDRAGFLDFRLGSVADEDGFAAPFDYDLERER